MVQVVDITGPADEGVEDPEKKKKKKKKKKTGSGSEDPSAPADDEPVSTAPIPPRFLLIVCGVRDHNCILVLVVTCVWVIFALIFSGMFDPLN